MTELIFHTPKRTYLQWLRGANPSTLERAERVRLYDDAVWRKARPEEAAELDALVGRVVKLCQDRRTYDGWVRARGEPFLVIDAWLGHLHGVEPSPFQGKNPAPVLLRPEWVSLDAAAEFVVIERGGPGGFAEARRDGGLVAEGSAGA